jgi:hypothetical protein
MMLCGELGRDATLPRLLRSPDANSRAIGAAMPSPPDARFLQGMAEDQFTVGHRLGMQVGQSPFRVPLRVKTCI